VKPDIACLLAAYIGDGKGVIWAATLKIWKSALHDIEMESKFQVLEAESAVGNHKLGWENG
jgi:hypothetical protein